MFLYKFWRDAGAKHNSSMHLIVSQTLLPFKICPYCFIGQNPQLIKAVNMAFMARSKYNYTWKPLISEKFSKRISKEKNKQ